MPQLDPAHFLSQLFWLVLSFCALFLFMRIWAVPRMRRLLHERHQSIDGKLMRIQELQTHIESLEKQQEKLAEESAQKIALSLKSAKDSHKKIMEDNAIEAKKNLDSAIKKIKADMVQQEKTILTDLRKDQKNIASLVLQQITTHESEKKE